MFDLPEQMKFEPVSSKFLELAGIFTIKLRNTIH